MSYVASENIRYIRKHRPGCPAVSFTTPWAPTGGYEMLKANGGAWDSRKSLREALIETGCWFYFVCTARVHKGEQTCRAECLVRGLALGEFIPGILTSRKFSPRRYRTPKDER